MVMEFKVLMGIPEDAPSEQIEVVRQVARDIEDLLDSYQDRPTFIIKEVRWDV